MIFSHQLNCRHLIYLKLDAEEELLQQESSTELIKLDLAKSKMVAIKQQQMELLLEAAKDREDVSLYIRCIF